jgi:hypothetical protein
MKLVLNHSSPWMSMSNAPNSPNSNLPDNKDSIYFGLTTFVAIIITVGIFWSFCGLLVTLACFQRLPERSLEGGPVHGRLTRGTKGANNGRGVQPDIEEVQLVCDEGVGLERRQDAQPQPLSVHSRTPESLLDVSFFIRMPQPHSPIANSPHLPPDLLKDELLIATTSSHLATATP